MNDPIPDTVIEILDELENIKLGFVVHMGCEVDETKRMGILIQALRDAELGKGKSVSREEITEKEVE